MSRLLIHLLTPLAALLLLGAGPALAQPADDQGRALGFEHGELGSVPTGWSVPSPGWSASLTDAAAASGERSIILQPSAEQPSPYGNVMTIVDASPYKGRRVKLTARVRADGGNAMMWLRADLADGTTGAFDNMSDRPIRGLPGNTTWSDATIELNIESNAAQLALGFLSIGGATVLIDDVRLHAGEPLVEQAPSEPRQLSERGLQNLEAATRLLSYVRFFHPSDQAVGVTAWDHFAVMLMEQAEPATDARDLAARLSSAFATVAPTLQVWAGEPADAPPQMRHAETITRLASWRHHGAGHLGATSSGMNIYTSEVVSEPATEASGALIKNLGGGVCCRLPIRVPADDERTLPHAAAETTWTSSQGKPLLSLDNRATRLASAALCWGVMQHFYPYFDVIDTDWDAALSDALTSAAMDADGAAGARTLERLVAALDDGHGNVVSTNTAATMLPLSLAWAGDDLVITGMADTVPGGFSIGDTIVAIDDKPLEAWIPELSSRISAATEGWRKTRLLTLLLTDLPTGDVVTLRVHHPDGTAFQAPINRIPLTQLDDSTRQKPANGSEVAPGIVYFDLNRASSDELVRVMGSLIGAEGIVFDLRGYPGDGAYRLMQHLCDEPIRSAQWHVPIVTNPDREGWTWDEKGRWNITPQAPRLSAPVAFLTDGRAISYAESIMGIVEHYELGEIVGSTTAGTNGNINPFPLPGGLTVYWTGMKVLKHDGSQHHGVGIAPTVPVTPTASGMAAGRDEVLERAVEVLSTKIRGDDSPRE